MPDRDPNAFATGRNPETASIAVTQGLLAMLSREQLQGVVAHEMAHIRNYDIRVMTVVAALVGAIALLSDWGARSMRFGGGGSASRGRSRGRKDGGGALLAVVMVVWVVADRPGADRGAGCSPRWCRGGASIWPTPPGAELTRNPLALAAALERIEAAAGATRSIKQGSAHLCIADPLERRVNEREGRFADLFATHPPMHKRIEALRAMAYQGS